MCIALHRTAAPLALLVVLACSNCYMLHVLSMRVHAEFDSTSMHRMCGDVCGQDSDEADQWSTMDVDDCTCADLQSHTSSMSLVTLVQSNSYLLTHSLLDSIANYIEYHCTQVIQISPFTQSLSMNHSS